MDRHSQPCAHCALTVMNLGEESSCHSYNRRPAGKVSALGCSVTKRAEGFCLTVTKVEAIAYSNISRTRLVMEKMLVAWGSTESKLRLHVRLSHMGLHWCRRCSQCALLVEATVSECYKLHAALSLEAGKYRQPKRAVCAPDTYQTDCQQYMHVRLTSAQSHLASALDLEA